MTIIFGVAHASGYGERQALEQNGELVTAWLADVLGSDVKLSIASDYHTLLKRLLAGEMTLAWMPPLIHWLASERGAQLLCVCKRNGGVTYRSALLVHRDRAYTRLFDCAGGRFAWTDRHSAAGYIFPRLLLEQAGLDEHDFEQERFTSSWLESAGMVARGEADLCACFISDRLKDEESASAEVREILGETARDLVVLGLTDAIPSDGVVVSPNVDSATVSRLREALFSMNQSNAPDAPIPSLFQAEALVLVTDQVKDVLAGGPSARWRMGVNLLLMNLDDPF